MQQVRLGQLLLDAGLIDQRRLDEALREQKRGGGKLGEVLVRLRMVPETALNQVLARQLNLPTVELDALPGVPDEVLARVPAATAHALEVLPLELLEGGRVLAVATCDVLRGPRLDELRRVSSAWVVPRLCGAMALQRALSRYYGPPSPMEPAPLRKVFPRAAEIPLDRELHALIELLVEKGLVSEDELLRKVGK